MCELKISEKRKKELKNLWENYKKEKENEVQKLEETVKVLLDDWEKYKRKISDSILSLDEYTNRVSETESMPGSYLCNFLERKTARIFGYSRTGNANYFEVKLNKDNKTYYIKSEQKTNATREEADMYFINNIKNLLESIVKQDKPLEKAKLIDNANKYSAKQILMKMAVLDNFYDFLRIYSKLSINILYNELINGDNNIGVCEKNYIVCKKSKELFNIKSENFLEQYLLSWFLWDYVNTKVIANEYSPNVILYGPPGTGKTFLAKQIAKKIIGIKEGEDEDKKLEESGQYAFVQFHPSYDYTDFVEGLRPTKSDVGDIGFELKNGIFKEFCLKAMKAEKENKDANFVFVIDEINRGEISKIFGELFFSIDPSYRGKIGAVKTQYSNMHAVENEVFYVPENVYIIGTMNDIDRSVESFDFAIRRRFTWKEITAKQSAENMGLPDETKNRMNKLNEEISKIEGLNDSYHIGGAYFLDSDGEPNQDYDNIWELRLEPLLKEYLRGLPDSKDKLKGLKEAYEKER